MKRQRRHPVSVVVSSLRAITSTLLLAPAVMAQQVSICGSLNNAYGPYDYRKDRDKLPIVDDHHFNSDVERLVKGASGYLGGDIDYVLRAFPNHHRALVAMMRLGEKEKTSKPQGANHTVECYFERAARFAPNDTVARALFATFLAKSGRREDAMLQLDHATRHAVDNPFAHYNIGLVYLEMKEYDKALVQAHRAIELGFPKTELANALKQAGAWREPPDQPRDKVDDAPDAQPLVRQ